MHRVELHEMIAQAGGSIARRCFQFANPIAHMSSIFWFGINSQLRRKTAFPSLFMARYRADLKVISNRNAIRCEPPPGMRDVSHEHG
jgi:hypothetical protein